MIIEDTENVDKKLTTLGLRKPQLAENVVLLFVSEQLPDMLEKVNSFSRRELCENLIRAIISISKRTMDTGTLSSTNLHSSFLQWSSDLINREINSEHLQIDLNLEHIHGQLSDYQEYAKGIEKEKWGAYFDEQLNLELEEYIHYEIHPKSREAYIIKLLTLKAKEWDISYSYSNFYLLKWLLKATISLSKGRISEIGNIKATEINVFLHWAIDHITKESGWKTQ